MYPTTTSLPQQGTEARNNFLAHLEDGPLDRAPLYATTTRRPQCNPGPHPAYHEEMRNQVRHAMPLLGRALDQAATKTGRQENTK